MGLQKLLKGNKLWEETQKHHDPTFFQRQAIGQHPEFLWIGCCDSRVPVEEITGEGLGRIFVHRNIANLVLPDDKNVKAAVEFAVKGLKVKHIIICGHYKCGGVEASLKGVPDELEEVKFWISPLKKLYEKNKDKIDTITGEAKQLEALVALNVEEQVKNMANLDSVKEYWKQGNELAIHGLVFELCEEGGKLVDLGVSVNKQRPVSK